MDFLSIFALFILLFLLCSAIGFAIFLGFLPGKIARTKKHPQADAIAVCGWWGIITCGLLLPIAFIWAHMHPNTEKKQEETDQ